MWTEKGRVARGKSLGGHENIEKENPVEGEADKEVKRWAEPSWSFFLLNSGVSWWETEASVGGRELLKPNCHHPSNRRTALVAWFIQSRKES